MNGYGAGTISIEGLSKAAVLAALYNGARAQGLGFLHYDPQPMTEAEAQTILDQSTRHYFDYLKGRVMKVDLSGDDLRTDLYDRDNGQGAAARIIGILRASNETAAAEVVTDQRASTKRAAMLVSEHLFDKTDVTENGLIAKVHMGLSDVADQLGPKVKDILGK